MAALTTTESVVLWTYIIAGYNLLGGIKNSLKRLLSFGYAVGAFVLVFLLGTGVGLLFITHANTLGYATEITAIIAAAWAAHVPPRRPERAKA